MPNTLNHTACRGCEKYNQYQDFRKSKQKYIEGETIKSFSDFEKIINENGFVYVNHKIKHAGWVINLQYRIIRNWIRYGCVNFAIRKDEINI